LDKIPVLASGKINYPGVSELVLNMVFEPDDSDLEEGKSDKLDGIYEDVDDWGGSFQPMSYGLTFKPIK
jgi:hypothetical protein